MNDHTAAIAAHFDQLAPNLDRWRRRNRTYYRDLEKLHRFWIPTGSRVLQVGSGLGDLLATVEPSFGIGIDVSPQAVAIAQQRHPQLQFHCLAAEELTPEAIGNPEPFDAIILTGVLSYLTDIQVVLEQLQAFCHPRTRLILGFHNFLWQPLLTAAEKVGQRSPQPPESWLGMQDVLNLLTLTGYEPIKQGRRFLLPRQIPLLTGWINRWISPLPVIEHLALTNYVIARPLAQPRSQPTVSVIVPARNEAGNIAAAVERLPELGAETELIFVEGHSRDQTWETIEQTVAEYQGPLKLLACRQTGKGKADAVRLGFDKASGDILMILDADLTVQPEDLGHFYRAIASGRGEFINGSRLVYPRSRLAMPGLNTLANRTFALIFSFLLGQPLKDTLCGTKVLWKTDYDRVAAGRKYFGDFDPFGDFDLLFGAAKLGLKIVEVPVRYQERSYGSSNIAHVREGLILARMCLYAAGKLKFPH
ncbi:glycosyltransferase [Synechococcus elongatus]|uniref:Probable glycosyltransferase n=1 Tax=Synechococcus elongatus (strain ATCC 33912 / PCC 7942 / FACHB-805) TaxID=1140 RepID=Q8KPR8_SYNE7|nr:glycosyltransferase [Synechococcus elongatus]AAM82701.1 unknown [Synechococcus elongatus PCC 7942 = FACHB-805]ABB57231.1 probable glycosyltransferase [Synechococcus elongatus PCC 7942 = FACHB-805]AJD58256.1 glycosyl transferase [Synechococcus elongatus UTEX 2973]MBD2587636.1 glycosyltransferase [Synechococcus elongatus FACHB-242]MBD2688585.1 glycosyltransferase [Synechococcus elongatus FACHB-1061]